MGVTHGADTERLEEIVSTLREQGHHLEALTREGSAMMDLLSESWSGMDLEDFSGRWRAGEQELHLASAALDACSRELLHQAGQQETASSGASSSASDGGSGPGPSTGQGTGGSPSVVAALPGGLDVDPKTDRTAPTGDLLDDMLDGELTDEEIDDIEQELRVDTDSPVVLETDDGDVNAAEAAVFAWWLATGGQGKVESMRDLKREADPAGREAYPDQGLDQQEDAFRHAYWNALMTHEHSAADAKMLSNAHEMHKDGTPLADKQESMDLYNNEVGRRIAEEHSDANREELKDLLKEAVEDGEMVCIDESGNLRPSNYNLD